MRPVEKGSSPFKSIYNYHDAKGALIERLGEFCSYCESHLGAGLSVEHVQPQSHHPDKACEWDNLLLACVNCNSIKGDTDINDSNLNDYLWPHINNTYLALKYSEDGIVGVNKSLPEDIQAKAKRLIRLVGLDRRPDLSNASDMRWRNRQKEWDKAQRVKKNLAENDTEQMRNTIVSLIESYFSIWMTVFSKDEDMKRRIIAKFRGTAKDCFDEHGYPIPRAPKTI